MDLFLNRYRFNDSIKTIDMASNVKKQYFIIILFK